MKFYINDKATVRLTEAGKRILRERYARLPADLREHFRPRWQTDEPIDFPIWELMHVFGPVLYMGSLHLRERGPWSPAWSAGPSAN